MEPSFPTHTHSRTRKTKLLLDKYQATMAQLIIEPVAINDFDHIR